MKQSIKFLICAIILSVVSVSFFSPAPDTHAVKSSENNVVQELVEDEKTEAEIENQLENNPNLVPAEKEMVENGGSGGSGGNGTGENGESGGENGGSIEGVNETNNDLCAQITEESLREAAGCNVTQSATNVGVNLINAVISVVAIISVIAIVIAGQRYIVANGDAGKINAAKNMLLYAVVGIIVSLLAFAIVAFVSNAIQSNANLDS